ncbi:MAG: ATP synthase F1 subunit delta [Patescibacteria group bacterium]|nr:ATP synthase F1 subunit delta [Patescibacteria group bacterium]
MKKNSNKTYSKALYKAAKGLKGKDLEKILGNFVLILARARKLKQAEKIIEEFKKYAKKQEGILEIKIISARKISDDLAEKIGKAFSKKVEITKEVDENLLGGFIVKTEDKIFDASVKTQLNNLKQRLIK